MERTDTPPESMPRSAHRVESALVGRALANGELFHTILLGRQPIFNRQLAVESYEILFRSNRRNVASFEDGDQATAQVILNTLVELGLDQVVHGRRAFLNLTYDFLVGRYPLPFPRDRVVLEVLESVAIDERLLAGLRAFSQSGYTIALDDFVLTPQSALLVPLAHIVKLDLQALGRPGIAEHAKQLLRYGVKLLAEKVETREELEFCRAQGFDYFQGFFFSRPEVVGSHRLPQNRLALMHLLAALQSPKTELRALEGIISKDVSLSYRLLRIINSGFYALPRKIDSIHRAVVLLGTQTIKNWAILIALSGHNDKPPELIRTTLVRAKMCEGLAVESGQGPAKETFFVVGLFSALDALLGTPMEEVVKALPLSEDIVQALLERRGPAGTALRCVLAYERSQWSEVIYAGLDLGTIARAWIEAVGWATTTARELGLD